MTWLTRAPVETVTFGAALSSSILFAGLFVEAGSRAAALRGVPAGSPEGTIAPMLNLMHSIDIDSNETIVYFFTMMRGIVATLVTSTLLYRKLARSAP